MRSQIVAAVFLSLFLPMCATMPQGSAKTDAEKIAEASLAASPEVTADATFLDWPSEKGGDFRVMKEGTNG
ncbi:MAG TPA: hypothetical protein VLB09_09205, partial [Nitrospiria bacterium]|nr:hypothetical protein [Nitrospiria bacterium]